MLRLPRPTGPLLVSLRILGAQLSSSLCWKRVAVLKLAGHDGTPADRRCTAAPRSVASAPDSSRPTILTHDTLPQDRRLTNRGGVTPARDEPV